MHDVNWTKWSSIAEILSSAAILITLIYLAIQTQQNTDATLSNARQAVLDSDQVLLSQVLEFPIFLTTETMEEFNNLTDENRARMYVMSASLFRTRENYWIQHQNGVIDTETWLTYRNTLLTSIKASEYIQARWDAAYKEKTLAGGFLNEINSALDTAEISAASRIF